MPAQPRTSTQAIVAAARRIAETDGVAAVTMQAVAAAVGVRAPSLYKRVGSRDALIRSVSTQVAEELGEWLDAPTTGDPEADLAAMAAALRAFAHANPQGYGLLFGPIPEVWRIPDTLNAQLTGVLLRITSALAGGPDALDAARFVVAWAHGFVSMELSGAFRLGGDIDEAFAYGARHLAAAVKTYSA